MGTLPAASDRQDREPSTALTLTAEIAPGEAALPFELEERIAAYQKNSKAAATWKAYEFDWADFCTWCQGHHRRGLPAHPETLRGYLTDRSGSLAAAPGRDQPVARGCRL